ncbi:MAG: esterase-like activity of phytase family protein [Pseudomonadota bacterium]
MKFACIALATALLSTTALAEATKVTATLKGHAILPALTFAVAPSDAPSDFAVSGRYTGPGNQRTEVLYSVEGRTWIGTGDNARRATGLSLPFVGQPVQGFSGVKHIGNGIYWALSDNGFGSKANSGDTMLMAHKIRPDWETGKVEMIETVFLSDPNKVLPFRIATEFTDSRYLTGADFDIESIQPVGDLLYFGDEFGPYVFATDMDGKVTFITETFLGERKLISPDHPSLKLPNLPDGEIAFDVRRSRGYEGMAQSPDGSKLYPLIEGPIWDHEKGAIETMENGQAFLRMLEFSTADQSWTDNNWMYPLEDPGHAIGDFNMISETRGLVIERDGNEGIPELACAEGSDEQDCFARPAAFKRVYLIEMGASGTPVQKLAYVDLMDIEDPDGVARVGGKDGKFTFPLVTIEDVDMVDAEHIIVGNDNNLPFSTGRTIGAADANEWILLHVGDMLK